MGLRDASRLSAPLGLAYDVALDGISLLMMLLTAIVLLLALLGARDRRRETSFVCSLLALTSFTMASFLSHDVLEFFIFFELTLVPSYILISVGVVRNAPRPRSSFHLHLRRFGVALHWDLVPGLRASAPDPGRAHL